MSCEHIPRALIRSIAVASLFVAFGRTAPMVRAAWSEPSLQPPFGNVAAPLNISALNQTKVGSLTLQGGLMIDFDSEMAGPLTGVEATASKAGGTPTIGVKGTGGQTTGSGDSSIGVYGITTATAGAGTHYGVLGVAGMNAANAIGIYGFDGQYSNAYAGYFRGRTRFEGSVEVAPNGLNGEGGNVSASSLCLLGTCMTSWSSVLPESWLFQESPPNTTFLANTNSRLLIGGSSDATAAFVLHPYPGALEASTLYTPGNIVLGAPTAPVAGDGVCTAGETCTAGNPDCWGQQSVSCSQGQICDPNGSGTCMAHDVTPPSGGSAQFIDATPTNIVCRRGVAQDYQSGVRDYHFYYRQGAYTANPGDYTNLGYSINPDYENITINAPETEFTCVVRARDWGGNEQAFAGAPAASVTTPAVTCTDDSQCTGSPRPFCCNGVCEFNCGGAPPGGSPAILKFEGPDPLPCDPGEFGYPDCLTLSETKQITSKPQTSRVAAALRSFGSWFADQFTKRVDLTTQPAHAAGQFGGDEPTRLTINHGVIKIIGGTSSVAEMEIGNNGTDIASTGNIYIRPNLSNQGSYFVSSGSTGTTVQNLVLTGELQAASASVTGTIVENNLPVLTVATIPSKGATSCTDTCAAAGKNCFASENPDPNATNWLGCNADGNTWPLGAQCLCVGAPGGGLGG